MEIFNEFTLNNEILITVIHACKGVLGACIPQENFEK